MTLKEKFQNIDDEGKTWSQIYDLHEKIADDYAIEFALWVKNNVKILTRIPNYTDKEVLEIFKKEKGL